MRLQLVLGLTMAMTQAALASEGFDLVIPGPPGVPILLYGVDISYAVVEGSFGLGKGVQNQPTVFGGRYVDLEPNVGHYYPSMGLRPGYGRLEIEPPANRKLPRPAAGGLLPSILVRTIRSAAGATRAAGGPALSATGDRRATWRRARCAGVSL